MNMQYEPRSLASGVMLAAVMLIFGTGADWRGIPESGMEKGEMKQARDEAEPDRCSMSYDDDWKESRTKDGGGGGSVVGGVGGGSKYRSPIFFSHALDFHILCGKDIPGLAPYADSPWHGVSGEFPGTLESITGDARLYLGTALERGDIPEGVGDQSGELSDDQRTLFRGLMAYYCYKAPDYQANQDYPMYYWCNQQLPVDAIPEEAAVTSALENLLPGKDFEHKNFLWMYRRGREMAPKVTEGFEKFEKNVPAVRAIYDGARKKAIEKYDKLREEHADVYETLQPVTDALEAGESPPEDCTALEKAQNNAAEQLGVEPTAQAVHEFRANHPLGRQLTEALAFCYSDKQEATKRFELEKRLLDETESFDRILQVGYLGDLPDDDRVYHTVLPPAITKRQLISRIRQQTFEQKKDEDGVEIPDFLSGTTVTDWHRDTLVDKRPTIESSLQTDSPSRALGKRYEKKGHYADKFAPKPTIETKREVPVGHQLEFPTKSKTVENEVCTDWKKTGRIEGYYWHGGKKRVEYEKTCQNEEVKQYEDEYGEDPFVIAGWEGEVLEKGMQVHGRANGNSPNNSVVWSAWRPDKDAPDDAVIIRGVYVDY